MPPPPHTSNSSSFNVYPSTISSFNYPATEKMEHIRRICANPWLAGSQSAGRADAPSAVADRVALSLCQGCRERLPAAPRNNSTMISQLRGPHLPSHTQARTHAQLWLAPARHITRRFQQQIRPSSRRPTANWRQKAATAAAIQPGLRYFPQLHNAL